MKTLRYLSAMALALSLALPAAAATGPWSWEDVSAKIPVKRDNWRVTSVGYFGDDWYFTNGQAFAKGGKVWKLWKDGRVTEVTGSLKNAGLTKVARIQSQDGAIRYFQDYVINKDNKVATWDGSKITTVSEANPEVTLEGIPAVHLLAMQGKNYLVAGGDSKDEPTSILLNAVDSDDGYSSGQVTDISDMLAEIPNDKWQGGISAWNGASWMIVLNHDLVRFDGEKLTYLGRTRDKFSSVTAMADGTFLLGGATTDAIPKAKLVRVTEEMPLIESAPVPETQTPAESTQPATTETATPAPAVTTFLWSVKPTALDSGKRMLTPAADGSYGVTATNSGGVKKVELLVNGTVKNTCEATGKTQIYCRIALKASDYAGTAKLEVKARATDINDVVAEGANETYWTQ